MSKGIIVHLDDDRVKILDPSKHYFDQLDTQLEYVCCENLKDFRNIINERASEVKALIFDLTGDKGQQKDLLRIQTEFSEEIKEQFQKFRVPIFIFSGFLPNYYDFEYSGTVFKFDKTLGFKPVAEKIRFFQESGFLDIFCSEGIVEKMLIDDLHQAFTKQFSTENDIENIIQSVTALPEDKPKRVQEIFTRIAVKSLMSKLLAPSIDEKELKLHPVEHYLRRLSSIDLWTGDILKHNTTNEYLLIITPRCNVAKSQELLVCEIDTSEFPSKSDAITSALRGDPKVSGYDRYLARSPLFAGGKVLLSKYKIIKRDILLSEFKVALSLSDELTNEILGKFGAYFFRSGITPWDEQEAKEHIKLEKDRDVAEK
ncbi:hypothetical protein [Xanthocytophaga flava]|uniref:hypothetical protein n=1 Tax=Xanthocytophaga flava TaxID=3048013 RepID=UPI0028D33250|nr:hypothetical protein [Xanthocytophaga flavus]MDJ1471879.1 hypothetical protein [Xanthocytophaga flavus]